MEKKILIGIVEDQYLFRQGLKAIISGWHDVEVIFESDEGYTVIEKLRNLTTRPDVLLVDLSLPADGENECSGLHVTDSVSNAFPEIKIIILSVHSNENFISQLIAHGANGYLVKDCDPREVHNAILSVYEMGSYINMRALNAIQGGLRSKTLPKAMSPPFKLTKREEEILQLICEQNTTEEIAEKLFISSKTVDGHRNNLLQKTGSRNAAGLVVFALTHNIIPSESLLRSTAKRL